MNQTAFTRRLYRSPLYRGCQPLSQKQNKLLNIFFGTVIVGTFLAMLGAVLYYVYAYAALSSGSHAFDWLLGVFSDFVYIMNVSIEESPYIVEDSSYPPLAIFMLYPFALICRGVFAKYASKVLTVDELTAEMVLHTEFWVAIILFVFICTVAIVLSVTKLFRLEPIASLKMAVITMLSAPFVFAVMRGNTIYFALIFVVLFLVLSRSENPVVREIGYLFLVLAGLIKIYPLFFGVFLLNKKKIWASVRIGIYTVVFFFLSFLLFGGSEDLLPFLNNLSGFASSGVRLEASNNLSITSLLHRAVGIFSPEAAQTDAFTVINIVILLLVFVAATIPAILTKNDFSRYAIVSAIIILIPSISYFYVLIFTLLPFAEFIRGYDGMTGKKRGFYITVFLLLFLMLLQIPQNYTLHSLAVIAMLVTECVSVAKERLAIRREKALVTE